MRGGPVSIEVFVPDGSVPIEAMDSDRVSTAVPYISNLESNDQNPSIKTFALREWLCDT